VIRSSIHDTVEPAKYRDSLHPDVQRKIGKIRTDLDNFSKQEVALLVSHGYEVGNGDLGTSVNAPSEAEDLEPIHAQVERIVGIRLSTGTPTKTAIRSIESGSHPQTRAVETIRLGNMGADGDPPLASSCALHSALDRQEEVEATRDNLAVQAASFS
jgi:hypothetical protein